MAINTWSLAERFPDRADPAWDYAGRAETLKKNYPDASYTANDSSMMPCGIHQSLDDIFTGYSKIYRRDDEGRILKS